MTVLRAKPTLRELVARMRALTESVMRRNQKIHRRRRV
jgi:hypothetical protein